jgi:F0F1-type ATP synthase membrane subunit b/b'
MGAAFIAEGTIQLVPDGTLILTVVVICAMVALLNRTLLRPINELLAAREDETKGARAEARRTMTEIQRGLEECERRLKGARTAGYALMEEQRVAALRESQTKVSVIRAEIAGVTASQLDGLGREAAEVRSMLEREAHQNAILLRDRILGAGK